MKIVVINFRPKKSNTTIQRITSHIKRNKQIYLKIACCVGYMAAASIIFDPATALADTIDDGGRRVHAKVVKIGKWVIVIKGCIDTIQAVMGGDFQSAKKLGVSYLLCFAILMGLPWSLDQIEGAFKGE